MYKEVLRSLEGIGLFPAISLIIFFGLFTIMFIYAFTSRKKFMDHMSELPLEDGTENSNLTPEKE